MADNSDVMDKIKELNNQDALNSKKQVAIQGNDGALKYISYDSKTKQYNVQTRSGGSANLRGNNPGNIIATAGSEKWEGVVGTRVDPEGRKFLVFDSMASGQSAAKNLLNSSQYMNAPAAPAIGAEPGTIGAAIYKWAPPNENDTASYIANVEKITGLDRNTKMSDLNPEQKEKVLAAIYNQEGNKAFNVTNETYSADGTQSLMGVSLIDGDISSLKKKAQEVKQQKIQEAKERVKKLKQDGYLDTKTAKAIKEFFQSKDFLPNKLDYYDNPTYRIQMWLIPGSSLKGMTISNFIGIGAFASKPIRMFYDSAVTVSYRVDNLVINSYVGVNKKTKKVFVTDFTFDLIEPNGCLFFDRLKKLVQESGYMDHKQTIFFLKISFSGKHNDENNKNDFIEGYRIIPFIFTDVKTKITSSGCTHKCRCSIASYGIATSREYFNFKDKIEYSTASAKDGKGNFLHLINETIAKLNKQSEENLLQDIQKAGKLPDAKVYAVDFSELSVVYNPNTEEGKKEIEKIKKFNGDTESLKSDAINQRLLDEQWGAGLSVYPMATSQALVNGPVVGVIKGTRMVESYHDRLQEAKKSIQEDIVIDMNIIKNSGEAIKYDSGKYFVNPGSSIEKVLDDITMALNSNIKFNVSQKTDEVRMYNDIPNFFRWEPVIQYYGQVDATKQKIYKITYKLRKYYDPALILSAPEDKNKQAEETFKLIQSEKGVNVEKKYEYIFTSKNTDILDLNIDLDMLWWVNSYENIALRPGDNSGTAVNNNTIADSMREQMELKQEYVEDGFSSKGITYTATSYAKDTLGMPELNLTQKYDMTPTGIMANDATLQRSVSKSLKDIYPVAYYDLAVRTPIEYNNEYNLFDPTILKGDLVFYKSGMNEDAVNRNDVKAASSFDQLYEAGNMIMLDMTIRGDPYWLMYNPDIYYSSPSFIFEMKTPTEIENGDFDVVKSYLTTYCFWGLYEVIEIKHTFSNGLFTQKLKSKANLNIRFPIS